MNIFRKIRTSLRLSEAIRQADKLHSENGVRYFVMPTMGKELIIFDRDNFRKYKQKGYIDRNATIATLERECVYSTPYGNGAKKLSADEEKSKRRAYFALLSKK